MKYEIIFCLIGLALLCGALGLFAWRLLAGRSDPKREWARTEENVAGLCYEYQRAKTLHAAGKLSDADFADRENELALRVIDETKPETATQRQQSKSLPAATILALCIVIPASSIGLYMYYGDFSSLDEKAVEQVRLTALQAKAQTNMAETVATLEESVKKNKDNLEAWEILADQYNETGNLEQARLAYENVVRLDPKNANAYAELADVLIALGQGALSPEIEKYAEKCIELDPYHQKGLMIGAAVAFNNGKYEKSAIYFNRLLQQIPSGNEVHDALQQQLEMVLHMGNLKEVPKDPIPPKPETSAEKMIRLGGGMPAAPEKGDDGVGLLPKMK